mgnify:CR=1 FL=1
MTKYELKPHDVDAVKFDGSNFFKVEELLGPHLTKKSESYLPPHDEEYSVYDVETKQWKVLPDNHYVVRDHQGAVAVILASFLIVDVG